MISARRYFICLFALVPFSGLQATTTITVYVNTDANSGDVGVYNPGAMTTDLRGALNFINVSNAGPYSIVFNNLSPATITLNNTLPIINLNAINGVTIDGSNGGNQITLNGNTAHRGLLVRQANNANPVTIQNMTFSNCLAIGGAGGSPAGGGGMGAGGAIFVDSGVTTNGCFVNNVTMGGCSATGGTGGGVDTTRGGGGGGGMGGQGGQGGQTMAGNTGVVGGGGGGGLGDNSSGGNGGSTSTLTGNGGGGGGGGLLGIGRPGGGQNTNAQSGGGAGGGGATTNSTGGFGGTGNNMPNIGSQGGTGGASGTINAVVVGGGGGGGAGTTSGGNVVIIGTGGGTGGNGGISGTPPTSGGNGGGGGGGFNGQNGGAGGNGGGGGGGSSSLGGLGGYGGGGGGTSNGFSGANGGFGGGGGGSSNVAGPFGAVNGGNGGFGGGGAGACGISGQTTGAGTGGFGGGGGGSDTNGTSAVGGAGGGNGGTGGGSGAALGGALFARGWVQLGGNISTTAAGSNTVFTNTPGGTGGTGIAAAPDIFIVSSNTGGAGTLTFAPPLGDTISIFSAIGDDSSNTLTGASNSATGTGNGGIVVQNGAGTTVLRGVNTYTGLTSVNLGILSMVGSIPGAAAVNSGGTLKGTGTIAGNVTVNSGGTIQPGTSIGTLTVGSLTLNAGQTTTIELDPSSSSLIAVTPGAATLAGTLNLVFDPGTYSAHTYTLLTATGGVSSTFTGPPTVTGLPTGGQINVIYNANSVLLDLLISNTPQGIPIPPHIGRNALALLNYLNSHATFDGLPAIISDLAALSPTELIAALNSATPARNAALSFTASNTAFQAIDVLKKRMDMDHFRHKRLLSNLPQQAAPQIQGVEGETALAYQQRFKPYEELVDGEEIQLEGEETQPELPYGSTVQAARGEDRQLIWIDGFADIAHFHSADANPAFDATWGGAILGYDYFGCDGMIGAGLGYTHAGIDDDHDAGDGSNDIYMLMIYGTTYVSDLYFEFSALGSFTHIESKRNVSFPGFHASAHEDHNGGQLVPHVGIGYDWSNCIQCWGDLFYAIEPFASFDWAILFEGKYSEKGAAPLNMHVKSKTSSILRSELGFHFYQEWNKCYGTWILKETLGYINKQPFHVGSMNAAIVGAPGSFSNTSFRQNQSLFTPGIEIFYRSNEKNIMASFSYDGEFGSGYIANELQFTIGKYF